MKNVKPMPILHLIMGLCVCLVANAQRAIQMRPACDTVSITYASGGSTSVSAINLPYKVELLPDPLPVHPILSDVPGRPTYNYHDGGPKVDLVGSVNTAKSVYSAAVGSAGAVAIVCMASAWSSWVSARADCRHDAEFRSEEDHEKCVKEALDTRKAAERVCRTTLQERVLEAMLYCDDDIDLFIEAYSGCENLSSHIESWERYWADEQ